MLCFSYFQTHIANRKRFKIVRGTIIVLSYTISDMLSQKRKRLTTKKELFPSCPLKKKCPLKGHFLLLPCSSLGQDAEF